MPKLYEELADWWQLLSAVEQYAASSIFTDDLTLLILRLQAIPVSVAAV